MSSEKPVRSDIEHRLREALATLRVVRDEMNEARASGDLARYDRLHEKLHIANCQLASAKAALSELPEIGLRHVPSGVARLLNGEECALPAPITYSQVNSASDPLIAPCKGTTDRPIITPGEPK